jgi:hypothetical protein
MPLVREEAAVQPIFQEAVGHDDRDREEGVVAA